MPRQLTGAEIATLASLPGVRQVAVENFLASMPADLHEADQRGNVRADARSYGWSTETVGAILLGIAVAYHDAPVLA